MLGSGLIEELTVVELLEAQALSVVVIVPDADVLLISPVVAVVRVLSLEATVVIRLVPLLEVTLVAVVPVELVAPVAVVAVELVALVAVVAVELVELVAIEPTVELVELVVVVVVVVLMRTTIVKVGAVSGLLKPAAGVARSLATPEPPARNTKSSKMERPATAAF